MTNTYQMEFVVQTYPLLVESRLGPRWARRDGGPDRSTARGAWRLKLPRAFFRLDVSQPRPSRPPCQRPRGVRLGKTKKAARYFERAIVAADKLGARYDLARALLDASRVIPERAEEYRRRGQQLLNELGAVVPEAERIEV